MQSMMYDVRYLFRYERMESVQEDGDAVAQYVKRRLYPISIHQTPNTLSDDEFGTVRRVGYRLYVNNSHDFREGDRVGDSEGPIWKITMVLDSFTGQTMDAEVL